MIPLDRLALEDEKDDDGEYGEGDHFLDDHELDKIERATVLSVSYAVCGDGEAVFEEGDAPGKQDDADQRPARGDFHLLQFEVPVPGKGHENIGTDQHKDGPECLHSRFQFFGAQR